MKRKTGPTAPEHYVRHIIETDQIIDLEPEFALMSRNPAIGKRWYEKYWTDIFPEDECPIPGRYHCCKPPRYYDKMYEQQNPDEYNQVKEQRREAMALSLVEGPSMESRIKVQDARIAMLKRSL